MSKLREIEDRWKRAVREGDTHARREAELDASDIVPGIAATMAGLSDDEAREIVGE
ncbi:MAG: hypothetical protein IRZ03_08415 [Acidobacterium ailaaui]|nr:hypothetical protein [Pseudacidobacterium ailaaui]